MSPGIIHALEPVQVHEEQRTSPLGALAPRYRYIQLAHHGLMVWQASNRVSESHLHHFPIELVKLAHEHLVLLEQDVSLVVTCLKFFSQRNLTAVDPTSPLPLGTSQFVPPTPSFSHVIQY